MIRVDRPVVVEGRYDKCKLASLIQAPMIITTNGFGVFTDKGKLRLIRQMAEGKGVILLTDSDTAGFRIRAYLKGAIGNDKIVNVYIPDVYGKERRKQQPSKEGKLGVEGIGAPVLLEAFHRAGVVCGEDALENRAFSKAELYAMGLSGLPNSAARRRRLLAALDLPEHLSANALAEVLGARFSPDGLRAYLDGLFQAGGQL